MLQKRGHSVIGYTADIAVSEDQFILAQRVTQAATDNASLEPMVGAVEQNCGKSQTRWRPIPACTATPTRPRWSNKASMLIFPTPIWQRL